MRLALNTVGLHSFQEYAQNEPKWSQPSMVRMSEDEYFEEVGVTIQRTMERIEQRFIIPIKSWVGLVQIQSNQLTM